MATLRLLLALLLMAVGTTFGALAISGYYEPHMTHGHLMTAPAPNTAPQPIEKPRLNLWLPKHGLAGVDDGPSSKPAAKPKVAAKTAPATKPKPSTAALPWAKDKRPQAATAQWPWNLFGI